MKFAKKMIVKCIFLCLYCLVLIGCSSNPHTSEEYQQAEKIALEIVRMKTYSNNIVMESSEYISKTDEYKMVFIVNGKRRFEVVIDMSVKNEDGEYIRVPRRDFID